PHKKKRARKADHGLPGDKGDNELKQLAYDTLDTSLLELSIRIKRLEAEEATTPPPNNPQSKTEIQRVKEMKERQRQLLGMVWLLKSCEASPTAVVPRNRIYARYSGMCADNEITPLSPASFGKLVRILYPDLKTRRLGMRGQSKYHYCGIKLKSDQNYEMPTQTPQPHHSYSRSRTLLGDLSSGGRHDASPISSSNSSISFEDTPVPVSHLRTPSYTPINSPSIAFSGTIGHQLPSVSHLMHVPNIVDLLNSNDSGISNPNVKLELPSIYPYLPAEADIDLADTLYSLYKVHINTLFESLRFMKLKLFFGSFASFNSILTTPVLKLYTSDSLLEWVKLCDVIMYKRMIRMLAKLQLQFGIPQEVIGQLRQISSGFVNTMTNNLINLKASKTFVIMKLKLAKHFVNILNRLVKIIVTGQAASRILTEPIQKEAMIKDWLKLDINEIVLHELPCNDTNTSKLLSILSEDFLRLLRYEGEPVPTQQVLDQIMHKFSSYIAELPGKFPGTNPRLIILLTCNLLTTCLREISLHSNRTDEDSGKGFGAWWIFRCWVDEYLIWCLELGGFFQDEFKPGAISSSSSGSDQEGGQGHGQGQDASEGHGQGQDPSQGHSHSQGGQGQGQGHGHFGGNLAGVSGGNEPSTHEPKQHHSHSNMDATGSSHYDLSNLEANMSTGVVDLLDGNYGSDEMAPEFSSEIVLKYEPTVNDILS
ncbi:RFX DNA-binding domain-containing protein, partial [Scheffersomyces amazonensis]|uniref:RFX DNA-binding domain-containing protein n=1 Tax=Scheffersomyces amazonensis TaxID=1078765 RepID=UPI00315DA36A